MRSSLYSRGFTEYRHWWEPVWQRICTLEVSRNIGSDENQSECVFLKFLLLSYLKHQIYVHNHTRITLSKQNISHSVSVLLLIRGTSTWNVLTFELSYKEKMSIDLSRYMYLKHFQFSFKRNVSCNDIMQCPTFSRSVLLNINALLISGILTCNYNLTIC